jgi:SNF2 family DNA or RNA helicase
VTYDSGAVEVCYGAMTKARVHAHMIPYPKQDSIRLDPSMWPIIKVQLKRRDGTNTHIISVFDALSNDFGTIDTSTALALAPLMDAGVVRTQARILMRKKEHGESPGQPISGYYNLSLNIYGKRRDSQRIGKFLGQKNVWLQAPIGVDSGIPTEVLHLTKAQPVAKLAPVQGYVTRTVEEIRNEVVGVFDSLHKSENLPEMEADPQILTPLLSHQKQGLYFMTNKEKERVYDEKDEDSGSLWRLRVRGNGQKSYYNVITGKEEKTKPPEVLGGILADMMGLGKTLSVLSLAVATLNDSNDWARRKPPPHKSPDRPVLLRNSKTTLLVAPLSTISNWEEQINTHIQPGALTYYIYHGSNRLSDLNEIAKYDILITTYNVVSSEYGRRVNGTGNGGVSPLEHTNWFRIVLDEAHMIREQSTRLSHAICELSAQRRWAVTGTPVQNRLEDLGALIKFLRIKPFDEKKGFTEFILSPFKNANPEILPKLRLLVDSITLRRLKDRINLPPRRDQIVRLEFNEDERTLYEWFAKDSNNKMRVITTQQNNGLGSKTYAHVLRAILRLRLICAHGKDLLSEEDLKVTEGWSKNNAIDLSDDEAESPGLSLQQACEMYNLIKQTNMDNCGSCERKLASNDPMADETTNPKNDIIGFMTHCYQIICKDCVHGFRKRVLEATGPDKHLSCLLCGQWIRFSLFELRQHMVDEMEEKKLATSSNPRTAKQLGRYGGPHTKTKALIAGLLQSQAESKHNPSEPPIKSVVFSGWTSHLDLIQIALEDNNIPYTRLDGKMSRTQRTAALDSFRGDPSITVILVSLMAGGLGLNLTAANNVYVMEPQFNPAAEAQAVDRVHRLGQKRPVTTTRFIMSGSFEEKMLDLQRKKQNLADLSMNKERLDKKEAVRRKLEELRSLFK